jgi:hypothetical protein
MSSIRHFRFVAGFEGTIRFASDRYRDGKIVADSETDNGTVLLVAYPVHPPAKLRAH